MKKIIHKANERGHTKIGWLDSYHSFSFGSYYDPLKMNFGALRVLNDDVIAPGKGFGSHPHANMEIISIALDGELAHKDSTGGQAVIKKNEIQVMSAGSGLVHSEFNNSKTKPAAFLQIWIEPNKKDIKPRHETLRYSLVKNNLKLLVSKKEGKDTAAIHQGAYLYLGEFEKNATIDYSLKSRNNGIFLFMVDGKAEIADTILEKRDAIGITDSKEMRATFLEKSFILLIEIPMD